MPKATVNILMVCLGNICRSPLAHGILESKLDSNLYYVDSAGTGAYHVGNPPDRRSIAVAKKHGIDITHQRAQQFKVSHFDDFDFIYVMDQSNYENVLQLARNDNDRKKVSLILEEVAPNTHLEVPDPYYGGDTGFENVYKMLEEACTVIANKI